MITSPDNPRVRLLRSLRERKHRVEQGLCLAEGVRLIEDAMRAGSIPALIGFTAPAREQPRAAALLAAAARAGALLLELSPAVLGTAADTVTSQGIIAALPIPSAPAPLAAHLILALDGVREPGNLGTLLRSAAAAGVELVLLAPGCTDPWSPKALRAGMGAHFRLTLVEAGWSEIAGRAAGRPVWVADARGALAYDRVDWTAPALLVIGGEAAGPGPEAQAMASGRIAIPMARDVESLNAAMAATVVLFEAARQRSSAP